MGFWVRAREDQGRAWHLTGADEPAQVPVPVPTLCRGGPRCWQCVPAYPEGTEFAVTMHRVTGSCSSSSPTPGPGIGDLAAVLRRGAAAPAPPGSAWTSRAGSRVDGGDLKGRPSGPARAGAVVAANGAAGGASGRAGTGPGRHRSSGAEFFSGVGRRPGPECLPDQRSPTTPASTTTAPAPPPTSAPAPPSVTPSPSVSPTPGPPVGRLPVGRVAAFASSVDTSLYRRMAWYRPPSGRG